MTPRNTVGKLIAGSLALWLSGFLFLVFCHAQPVAAVDSCPLMKLGAHCDWAEKEQAKEKASGETESDGIDCCAFLPAFFDKTRTNDIQTVAVALPKLVVDKPRLTTRVQSVPTSSQYVSIVTHRNDTFLKNRTFRI